MPLQGDRSGKWRGTIVKSGASRGKSYNTDKWGRERKKGKGEDTPGKMNKGTPKVKRDHACSTVWKKYKPDG